MARTPEQVREAKRLHMAKKRAADPDAVRAYGRNYHAKNRVKQIEKMRAYYARRFFWGRAMKLRRTERATPGQLWSLWKTQKGLCGLTGRKLDRTAQLDHVLPRARGGGDNVGNLRWVCNEANLAKRDLTDEEFLALCDDVMRWIGQRLQEVHAL